MPIEFLSDAVRGGVGAFGLSTRVTVTASRDLQTSDIGATLVVTAAATLRVPAGFGVAGNVIYVKRIGVSATVTLTADTAGGAVLYDLSGGVALPDHGLTMLDCESPGVWSRQG